MHEQIASTAAPPWIRIKDVGWFLYLYPIRLLAQVLPLSLVYALVPLGGWMCSRLPGLRQRLRARLALGLPALSGSELDHLVACYYRNAVSRFFDDLLMGRIIGKQGLAGVEIRNLEALRSAQAQGKGVILLGVHTFASRLGRSHMRAIGFPFLSLRDLLPPDPWAGRVGQRYLRPRYSKLLSQVFQEEVYAEDPDCTLKMVARLRAGGLVYLAIDAEFTASSLTRPFLGEQRRFGYGYLAFARLFGCPLIPFRCHGDYRHLMLEFGDAIPVEPAADTAGFVTRNLPKVLDTMAEEIVRYPADWQLWIRW